MPGTANSIGRDRSTLYSRNIDAAADEQIVLVSPPIEPSGFFRRQHSEVGESCFVKPDTQFIHGVMVLVFWSPPVERIADTIFVTRVSAEVDDLIERFVDDWQATKDRSDMAERHQDR